MGDVWNKPISTYVWSELARWRDEALAEGERELASRIQKVIMRLHQKDKVWRCVRGRLGSGE